jgi:hypothetical protein
VRPSAGLPQVEIALARIATKLVSYLTVRPKSCCNFVIDPATGALEVAPTHRDKATKAFQSVLASAKARLYFNLSGLYCRKFTLKVGNVVFRLNSQFGGYFDKLL